MSTALSEAILESTAQLSEEHQRSVLDYANFLRTQERECAAADFEEVDEEDESAWDKLFADENKTSRLAERARKAMADGPVQGFENSGL